MAIDDTWFPSRRRGPDGKKLPAKKHGRGKRWRVRYEDPNTGEGREQLFARLDDAKLFDANIQADISRGRYVDPKAGRVTVKAQAEEWLSGLVCDDATLERMRRAFRLHVYPDLGELPIGTLKTARLQQWVKARGEHLARRPCGSSPATSARCAAMQSLTRPLAATRASGSSCRS